MMWKTYYGTSEDKNYYTIIEGGRRTGMNDGTMSEKGCLRKWWLTISYMYPYDLANVTRVGLVVPLEFL